MQADVEAAAKGGAQMRAPAKPALVSAPAGPIAPVAPSPFPDARLCLPGRGQFTPGELLAAVAGIAVALSQRGSDEDWATRKLPLGSLMAIATPFAVAMMFATMFDRASV